MAEFIQKTDTLNEGREKLNEAIKDSETAKVTAKGAEGVAGQAKQIAQTAEDKADSVQTQFDQVIIEGDSSVEAAQARVDEIGEAHPTLKAGVDDGFTKVTSQLADIAYNMSALVGDGAIDDRTAIQNIINTAQLNKVKKVVFPKATYRINDILIVSGDDLELDFSGSTILSYAKASSNYKGETGIFSVTGEFVETDVSPISYYRSIYDGGSHKPPANSPQLIALEGHTNTTSKIKTSNNSYFSVGDEIMLNGWTKSDSTPFTIDTYYPQIRLVANIIDIDNNYI